MILALAAAAIVLGVVSFRAGHRTLANRRLNPEGGLDNLAVTLIGIGIVLIGWGTVGPVVYLLR
jgi:hypothetical protein